MHCARLGYQCLELLRTGRLQLPMDGSTASWLLSVRRGEVPFSDWWDRVLELDRELEEIANDDSISDHADIGAIDAWSVQAHLRSWSGEG